MAVPKWYPDRHVGERIMKLRTERGMSQRELSFDGVSYAYISRVEGGSRVPSFGALVGIADRLDTTVMFLAHGKTKAEGRCPCCGRG